MTQHVRIIIGPEEDVPLEINLPQVTDKELKMIHNLIYSINGPTEYENDENNSEEPQPSKLSVSDLQRWRDNLQDYLVSDVLEELDAELARHYVLIPVHHDDMVPGQIYYITPAYAKLWRDNFPRLEFKLICIKPHHSEPNQFLMEMECTETGEIYDGHCTYAFQKVLIPQGGLLDA